ncbi:MAG: peptide-methionine (S)-S-oxide reductase MsrA [Methanosarcinales archaeon]|nr:peptide-methionine (S)-S-oxide reductase MsrA [Methanosarcinales archaeon]
MKRKLFLLLLLLITTKSFTQHTHMNIKNKQELATFGGGCFWCTEAIFQELKGVHSVESGYAGGQTKNPTYADICTGTTGHAEVIQITYDPSIIQYELLLEIFFKTHNPTTPNQQGADRGTQYRSAIFYHTNKQKDLAEHIIKDLESNKVFENPIVTEVTPFNVYYKAENYHQNYYENNPTNSYCNMVINPKLTKFMKEYKDKLKDSR